MAPKVASDAQRRLAAGAISIHHDVYLATRERPCPIRSPCLGSRDRNRGQSDGPGGQHVGGSFHEQQSWDLGDRSQRLAFQCDRVSHARSISSRFSSG